MASADRVPTHRVLDGPVIGAYVAGVCRTECCLSREAMVTCWPPGQAPADLPDHVLLAHWVDQDGVHWYRQPLDTIHKSDHN